MTPSPSVYSSQLRQQHVFWWQKYDSVLGLATAVFKSFIFWQHFYFKNMTHPEATAKIMWWSAATSWCLATAIACAANAGGFSHM
jgi:hypothetical protein